MRAFRTIIRSGSQMQTAMSHGPAGVSVRRLCAELRSGCEGKVVFAKGCADSISEIGTAGSLIHGHGQATREVPL
jgi:hypothetical protein